MADQLLAQVQDLLEGTIDFAGQKKTEKLSTAILAATGIVAFLIGFVQNNIHLTLWTGLLGTFIAFLVVVPPWPAWNENPEQWLRSTQSTGGVSVEVDGKKVQ